MIRRKSIAVALVLGVVALGGCSSGPSPDGDREPSPTASTPAPPPVDAHPLGDNALLNGLNVNAFQVRSTLQALEVKPAAPMTGFSASLFPTGKAAADFQWPTSALTKAGCPSTTTTLARDGADVQVKDCKVSSGTWVDPYTGASVDKDAVVASFPVSLEEAWRSGGSKWTAEQRTIFANSSVSLVSASAANVKAKGTAGADTWGPSWTQAQCAYAVRYVMIKSTFGLSLTSQREKDNLSVMLGNCGDFSLNGLTGQDEVQVEQAGDSDGSALIAVTAKRP